MEVTKMTKTKKSTVDINGSKIQAPSYDFRKAFLKWKKTCDGISSKDIASIGSPYAKEGRQTYPKTLYLQLQEHVRKYLRDGSSNTGNDGLFKVLDSISELLTKKAVFYADDIEDLEELIEAIDAIENSPKLNPRNTVFTRPTRWRVGKGKPREGSRAKNKIDILDEKPQTIYGHYRDKYFEDKYGLPEKKGWWSLSPNDANPPLAQAIYGKGDLVKEGLYDIIKEAIEEIDKTPIPSIQLKVQRSAGSLALIPSVRKQVFALLKRNDLFSGGKPKLNQMATILQGMEFAVGTKSFGARSAKPQLIVQYVGNLPELASPLETFSLQPFGKAAMASLIMKVVGKDTYKLKNGNYLDIKGKTKVPEPVKKSWMEHLWRD